MISNKEGENTEKAREASIKPIAGVIQEVLQLSDGKEKSIKDMVSFMEQKDKGYSVNFRNLLREGLDKYTIEFRLPNGTLEYETIR